MKKALIGMIAGAAALGGAVVPASAGYNDDIWTLIEDDSDFDTLESLMLMTDLPSLVDSCGNGIAKYTVFGPDDTYLDAAIDALGETVASLSSKAALVKAILSDHIVKGAIADDEWADATIKVLTAVSGASLSVTYYYPYPNGDYSLYNSYDDVQINGVWIDDYDQACNGWVYTISGVIDTSKQDGTTALDQNLPGSAAQQATGSLPNTL